MNIDWKTMPAALPDDPDWAEFLVELQRCYRLARNGPILSAGLVHAGKNIPVGSEGLYRMINRIEFYIWLAQQPNWDESGTKPVEDSPQAAAQHVLVTKSMNEFKSVTQGRGDSTLYEGIFKILGVWSDPYPYILRKAPYTRLIARWLYDPYCNLGFEVFGKFLHQLVPALINWGMSHLMSAGLVGPYLEQTIVLMDEHFRARNLKPEDCLLDYNDGKPAELKFEEKDYSNFNQGRNDARLAKAYFLLLREQAKRR